MKCLCIGICQLSALVRILQTLPWFTCHFEIIEAVVFLTSPEEMENILQNVLPTVDLVISQPVSQSYSHGVIYSSRILRDKCLQQGIPHLIVSNCYFTGYDPLPFQVTDLNGKITPLEGITYFPAQCLQALLNGNKEQALQNWNSNIYSGNILDNNLKKTLDELHRRESSVFDEDFEVDVKIADYIENNFRDIFLFHTYNHPTNALLKELLQRLLVKIENLFHLKLGNALESPLWDIEQLGNDSLVPSPQVFQHFQLKFTKTYFTLNKKIYTISELLDFLETLLSNTPENLKNLWLGNIKWKESLLNF